MPTIAELRKKRADAALRYKTEKEAIVKEEEALAQGQLTGLGNILEKMAEHVSNLTAETFTAKNAKRMGKLLQDWVTGNLEGADLATFEKTGWLAPPARAPRETTPAGGSEATV